MLLIRFLRRNGHGTGAQFADMLHELRLALLAVEFLKRGKRGRQTATDSHANQGIRNDAFGEKFIGANHEVVS
jgi:hypothetical protein